MGVAKYQKDKKDGIQEVILQSGIKVKPVYTPEDLEAAGFQYERDLADPGTYPFTRGIHPLGYRSRAWTTRQYTGFGTPAETNERFKLMIAHGQTGLNVAFDLPTQMGLDSDDPLAEGEVGRVGMAVDSLRDFEIAFEDIQLDKIGVGLTINAVASIMLAMYQAMARKIRLYERSDQRHPPKRHPQGDDRPRGLDLPHRAGRDPDRRHHRVFHEGAAQVQPGQRLRLPHPGIRGHAGPGDRLCLPDRQRLYRRGRPPRLPGRTVCGPLLLQPEHLRQPLGAGGQVPGRPQALGQKPEGEDTASKKTRTCTSGDFSAAAATG